MNDDLNLNLLKAKQLQKKREMRSVLLFVFFLFITILTLSQILVMHSQKNNTNFNQIKLMQEELKLMDYSIDKMLKENHVLPMQVWYSLKQYNDNLKKFSTLMNDISFFSNDFNDTLSNHTSNFEYKYQEEYSVDSLITQLTKCDVIESIENTNASIYTSLINVINDTFTDQQNLKIDYYNKLELLLKSYLNRMNSTDLFNDMTLRVKHEKCVQTVLSGFYFIFNEQFSEFYEKNSKLRQILASKKDNKTLQAFIKSAAHITSESNTSAALIGQKHSLKTLDQIFKHYQQTNLKKNYFNSSIKLCDSQPPILYGPLNITEKKFSSLMLDILEKSNYEVNMGGSWAPRDCQARHKIAIIIPYRDRIDHLITLLYYLHPILQRQQLQYKIYVSEQAGNGTFNKAIIMNAAFIYAFDENSYDCYCFHDVDLVPEDDRNLYSCARNPKHMSIGVDEMNYKLQYEELIGGVLILKTEHLIASNGYSNLYWGWGAEDDDLYYRFKGLGYKIERPPLKIGRYKMMKHQKRKPQLWSKRAKLLYSSVNRMTWDGISSANYTLLKTTVHKLYTHLLIDVGVPPAGFN